MKIYRAKGNNEFELGEAESFDKSLVKLKISTVFPTNTDISVYQGRMGISYPRVPCHMATAIVSEDRDDYGLKRGSKVIINPYVLSSIDAEGVNEVERYGLDRDGFLRDFISLPIDNLISFPEDVKENEAVFTELVAVALASIHSFELNKGEYIAVIGGSILTNVICQLALYYQAIPILISNDTRYLELAAKCGIYYTIDETLEDTAERVRNITGGRMAEHTVIHAKAGVTPRFLCALAGRGGDCLITSLNPTLAKLETDVSQIAKKHLTVKGVSCGVDEINSAVNMLAQKQLKLLNFIDKTVAFDDAKMLFDELSENPERYICPIIKV